MNFKKIRKINDDWDKLIIDSLVVMYKNNYKEYDDCTFEYLFEKFSIHFYKYHRKKNKYCIFCQKELIHMINYLIMIYSNNERKIIEMMQEAGK